MSLLCRRTSHVKASAEFPDISLDETWDIQSIWKEEFELRLYENKNASALLLVFIFLSILLKASLAILLNHLIQKQFFFDKLLKFSLASISHSSFTGENETVLCSKPSYTSANRSMKVWLHLQKNVGVNSQVFCQ